ncbi:hypothetical protein NLU13_1951 [Sarocladium strictum]|uniref:Uncharacterized protein n=1 Tax=Sarocladium strictum TaxID=5046 RepID=A0AA39GSR5_SARSR|nr:hypothetical protein NLU13_1951 [Sarocladium strictum]
MCTYAVARFSCRHEIWGRRTKLCTIGEDFRDGHLEADCTIRGTHPLKTMLVSDPCYNCFKIKALPMLCREKLQHARSVFKERWPEELPSKHADSMASLEQEVEALLLESKVDLKDQASTITRPQRLLRKRVKSVPISDKETGNTPQRKGGLPAAPKTTPPKGVTALPTLKMASSKTTPPRLSRLALPRKKTPEKSVAPPKVSTGSPEKVATKLPKPGFLRK